MRKSCDSPDATNATHSETPAFHSDALLNVLRNIDHVYTKPTVSRVAPSGARPRISRPYVSTALPNCSDLMTSSQLFARRKHIDENLVQPTLGRPDWGQKDKVRMHTDWLKKQLHNLNIDGGAVCSKVRLEIFASAFDRVIAEFPLYAPLLREIKV